MLNALLAGRDEARGVRRAQLHDSESVCLTEAEAGHELPAAAEAASVKSDVSNQERNSVAQHQFCNEKR